MPYGSNFEEYDNRNNSNTLRTGRSTIGSKFKRTTK